MKSITAIAEQGGVTARNRGSIMALIGVVPLFIAVDAAATIPDVGSALRLDISFKPIKHASETAKGRLVLSSNLDEPVEITRIETDEEEIYEEYNDELGTSVPTVSINQGSIELQQGMQSGDILYPSLENVYDLTLEPPIDDGYFSETVRVFWRYPGTETEIDVSETIYFKVRNERFIQLSENDFHSQTQPGWRRSGVMNGKKMDVITFNGFSDGDQHKGEEGGGFVPANDEPVLRLMPREAAQAAVDDYGLETEMVAQSPVAAASSPLTIKYCAKIQFRDNYQFVPTDTTGMDWWRPKGDLSLRNFNGLKAELWDRDDGDGSNDDFIWDAYVYYTADGQYACTTFTVDSSQINEDYPDLYLVARYQVIDVVYGNTDKRVARMCADCDCNAQYRHSWRNQTVWNVGSSSGPGEIPVVKQSLTFGAKDSSANAMMMQLNSAQKFLQTWRSKYMTDDIYITWSEELLSGSTSDCIKLGKYVTFEGKQLDMYRRWDMAAHEAGHIYRNQLLGGRAPGDKVDGHRGYCSYTDYQATSEGWASFVAMRSWFPYDRNISRPILGTAYGNYEVEPGAYQFLPGGRNPRHSECGSYACASLNCDCYSRNEMMAMRAFWDMWDSSVDNLDDASTQVYWEYLAKTWTLYPPGDGPGEAQEYNTNMRDYHHNSRQIMEDIYDDIWRVYQEGQTDMVCQSWNS